MPDTEGLRQQQEFEEIVKKCEQSRKGRSVTFQHKVDLTPTENTIDMNKMINLIKKENRRNTKEAMVEERRILGLSPSKS